MQNKFLCSSLLFLFSSLSFGSSAENPCAFAQIFVENIDISSYQPEILQVTTHDSALRFYASKPQVRNAQIEIEAWYTSFPDKETSLVFCKFKTRQAIGSVFEELPLVGPLKTCSQANAAFIEKASQSWPQEIRRKMMGNNIQFVAGEDQSFQRGDQWKRSVPLIYVEDPFVIRASSLRTPAWVPRLGGMQYCKLLDSDGALMLVREYFKQNGS